MSHEQQKAQTWSSRQAGLLGSRLGSVISRSIPSRTFNRQPNSTVANQMSLTTSKHRSVLTETMAKPSPPPESQRNPNGATTRTIPPISRRSETTLAPISHSKSRAGTASTALSGITGISHSNSTTGRSMITRDLEIDDTGSRGNNTKGALSPSVGIGMNANANPWTVSDPALGQMSPYKRGPRARYFPVPARDTQVSTNSDATANTLIITKLGHKNMARTGTTGVNQKAASGPLAGVKKHVTISDCPPQQYSASNSAEFNYTPVELSPAQEFKSAPASAVQLAAELTSRASSRTDNSAPTPSEDYIKPSDSETMKLCGSNTVPEPQEDSPHVTDSKVTEPHVTEPSLPMEKETHVIQKETKEEEQKNGEHVKNVFSEPSPEKLEDKKETSSGKEKTDEPEDVPPESHYYFEEEGCESDAEENEVTPEEESETARALLEELQQYKHVLRSCTGDANHIEPRSRVVRIFLSSTFSDTKGERNYLARLAYPRLAQWCSERGLEFQVVDMRWGVTQDAVFDHASTQLCLQEVANCQRLSRGTNFVGFLGNRYGYQAPPTEISSNEFEALLSTAKENNITDTTLLEEWYQLDTNALPPKYILKSITSLISDYSGGPVDDDKSNLDPSSNTADTTNSDDNRARRLLALDAWNRVSEQLLDCLRMATQIAINAGNLLPESLYKHHKSVTEREIEKGILGVEKPKALFFHRTLDGLTQCLSDPMAHKFIDLHSDDRGKPCINNFSKNRIAELNRKIQTKLPFRNTHAYHLPWASLSVNAKEYMDVDKYLSKFCDDFVTGVQRQTLHELQESQLPEIIEEVAFHSAFVNKRITTFCGRTDILRTIQSQLQELDKPSSPIVMYGRSGCGKTSVMSMIGKHVAEWLDDTNVVTVIRFLGTTPISTKVVPMLQSVCGQLCVIYHLKLRTHFENSLDLFQYFTDLINQIANEKAEKEPLIILLDSLDQLSSEDGAHYLTWLPKVLPPYVKIVTSTLEHEFDILQTLKKSMPSEDAVYIEINNLTDATLDEFVAAYLEKNGRTVTAAQRAEIKKVFTENTHSIYLRLLMERARKLSSYDTLSAEMLPKTAEVAIGALFDTLEGRFGRTLVAYAFTILTVCPGGVSTREMDDALSLADTALCEVYEYHDPPIQGSIRIPPLLWARIQYEIEPYLTEHDVNGVTAITWYHMLFQKYSLSRYSDETTYPAIKQSCFYLLRELFSHTGQVCRTIYLTKRKKEIPSADRGVVYYPLSASGKRKLMILPHLIQQSSIGDLTGEILCNLQWLLTKLEGTSYSQLRQDFNLAKSDDKEAHLVQETLNLGSAFIQDNPKLLPLEIVSRLGSDMVKGMPNITKLIEQCFQYLDKVSLERPLLIPLIPSLPAPNNLLKTTIHGLGKTDLNEIFKDKYILVHGQNSGFQVWNLETNAIQFHLCDGYKVESCITFQDENTSLAAQTYRTLVNIWNVEIGALVKTINLFPHLKESPENPFKWALEILCISHSKNKCLVRIQDDRLLPDAYTGLVLCDLETGVNLFVQLGPENIRFPVKSHNLRLLMGAIFSPNDTHIIAWCNGTGTLHPSLFLVNTQSLQSEKTLEIKFRCYGQRLSFNLTNYHLHGSKPYLLIGLRMFDFIVINTDTMTLVNDLEKTKVVGRVADLCWFGYDVLLAEYIPRKKKGTLIVYEGGTKETNRISLRNGHPRVLRQMPQTSVVAVGFTFIGLIDFYNMSNSQLMYTLLSHSASVETLLFSSDGQTLVSSSENSIKVWALDTVLKEVFTTSTKQEVSSVKNKAWSDVYLQALKIEETLRIKVEQALLLKSGVELAIAFSHDPTCILNLDDNGLRAESQMLETFCPTDTLRIAESTEGYFLYGLSSCLKSGGVFHTVLQKWNVTSRKLLLTSEPIDVQSDSCLSVFPKSGNIAVLKRMSSDAHILTFEPVGLTLTRDVSICRPVLANTMILSPEDTKAVTVNPRSIVLVWMLNMPFKSTPANNTHEIDEHSRKDIDADGDPKIQNGSSTTVEVTPIYFISIPKKCQPTTVQFIQDHSLLLGVYQGYLRLVNLKDGFNYADVQSVGLPTEIPTHTDVLSKEARHNGEMWGFEFHPDKRRIVTISNDKSFKVADFKEMRLEHTQKRAHNGRLRSLAISPDGLLLATGGRDKTLRLWSMRDYTELVCVNLYEDVYKVYFACDGRVLIALSHNFGERRLAIFRVAGVDSVTL